MALTARHMLPCNRLHAGHQQRAWANAPCRILVSPQRHLARSSSQADTCNRLHAGHQQRVRANAPCRTLSRQMHLARSSQVDTEVSTSSSQAEEQTIPPGCSRYSISIRKPLGIVLEQNKASGNITVAEVSPEGNAAKTGMVAVGDQLIACSGVTYGKEEDYGGAMVKKDQQRVRVNCLGQSFKTVSAAIGSHPGNWEVKLEFQRCGAEPVTSSQ